MHVVPRYGQLTQEAFNINSSVDYYAESAVSRIFKLTYSYQFGNNKVKGKKNRKSSSKEEIERIKQE
jgi:iron complex outermembrane recepter protein